MQCRKQSAPFWFNMIRRLPSGNEMLNPLAPFWKVLMGQLQAEAVSPLVNSRSMENSRHWINKDFPMYLAFGGAWYTTVEFSVADFLPNDVFLRLTRLSVSMRQHIRSRSSLHDVRSCAILVFASVTCSRASLMILNTYKQISAVKLCVSCSLEPGLVCFD